MMLIIAPEPEASYSAPGCSTTSILAILSAGKSLKRVSTSIYSVVFPLMRILTPLFPAIEIPLLVTKTPGTLRITSCRFVFIISEFSKSTISFSAVCLIIGLLLFITTSFNVWLPSFKVMLNVLFSFKVNSSIF